MEMVKIKSIPISKINSLHSYRPGIETAKAIYDIYSTTNTIQMVVNKSKDGSLTVMKGLSVFSAIKVFRPSENVMVSIKEEFNDELEMVLEAARNARLENSYYKIMNEYCKILLEKYHLSVQSIHDLTGIKKDKLESLILNDPRILPRIKALAIEKNKTPFINKILNDKKIPEENKIPLCRHALRNTSPLTVEEFRNFKLFIDLGYRVDNLTARDIDYIVNKKVAFLEYWEDSMYKRTPIYRANNSYYEQQWH
ncbi:MAG: hypothetical protein LPK00_05720 [Bacillaceae bacterium]|nr:hypothetical protein [Bacillaceae bacterium]